jgi:hypothetical protein
MCLGMCFGEGRGRRQERGLGVSSALRCGVLVKQWRQHYTASGGFDALGMLGGG